MTSINRLSSDDALSQGDLVPIYSNGQGAPRKATAAAFVAAIGDSYVTQAQAQANAATATVAAFQSMVYPGVYAIFPTTRPNGTAMQDGDRAVILLGGVPTEYVRTGGTWIVPNVGAANLAASSGSSLVGFIQSGTGAVARTVQDKNRDWVSPEDFGATGNGVTDDSPAMQAAINTGKNVHGPANYRISTPLFMQTTGQQLLIDGEVRMDASLGKPCLYLGASNSAGTPSASVIINMGVKARFIGNGTKTDGSCGVSLVKATTTAIEVLAWNFYAGIEARGLCLVNHFKNPDLRQNVYGVYDRVDGSAAIDLQGSRFFGGRIEANQKEGVKIGSVNVGFIGTVIEGNGAVANGGTGLDPEVSLDPGFATGAVTFTDCYMETLIANTGTAMIRVNANAARRITISGGQFYGRSASVRYIVESLSNSTDQSYTFNGGIYREFKNYLKATLTNNCFVTTDGVGGDIAPTLTADVSASSGGAYWYWTRGSGLLTNQRITANDLQLSDAALGPFAYGLKEANRRVTFGSSVASGEIIPAAQITTAAIQVFEVLAVGRNSSTTGASILAYLTVAGNAAAPGTILNTYIANQFGAGGSVAFAINGANGIDINTLAGGNVFDFYIRKLLRT